MELDTLKKELFDHVDAGLKTIVADTMGPLVAEKVAESVAEARAVDVLHGRQSLDNEKKQAFVTDIKRIAMPQLGEKAAYLTINDQTGGYLVPTEVHSEILRIAETTGIVMRDARKFGTTEIDIPIYTGAAMQGSFIGEDSAASETQQDLGVARLKSAKWANIVRLSNTLIAKANVNVAEWLMALIAEGYSYRLDREGFMGGTYARSPFVGVLASDAISTQTLASGRTGFEDFTLEEASIAIGSIATSALNGAGFYFHRDVWARIRTQKSGDNYVFNQDNTTLASLARENGIQPVGSILGYPVYTTDVLPAYATSAISTKFGAFANLNLTLGIGDNGPMSVARSESAVINGVSTFERDQTAMRFIAEPAVSVIIPDAAVVFKTAAS